MNGEREPLPLEDGVITRYGVFRRSALNGLFHPYFINYGRDKIYYYWRLNREGSIPVVDWVVDTQFYVLPQSFGCDLPHIITNASRSFRPNDEHEMFGLYKYLVYMNWHPKSMSSILRWPCFSFVTQFSMLFISRVHSIKDTSCNYKRTVMKQLVCCCSLSQTLSQ